ncbi:MAG: transporter substrate-binding domain-containing protein [Magnetococcales bacterium]|nr:transporter substrate-binding domain-containing protein [Magnetococcales bacterium]
MKAISAKVAHWCVLFCLMAGILIPAMGRTAPKPLVIACSKAWPPFSYLDEDQQPKGLLVDFWRAFGRENGLEVIFKLVNWGRSIDLVRQGQADFHAGLYFSEERDVFMDFSEQLPLPVPGQLFISHKLKASNLKELGNIPVGVVGGGFSQEFMKTHHPEVNIRIYPNSKAVIEAGFSGEVLAFITDYPTAMYYLHSLGSPDQYQVMDTLYTHHLRAGVQEGRGDLLKILENGVAQIPHGEVERIIKKWIWNVNVEVVPPWLYPVFTGVGLFLLLSASILYARTLRRQVNLRTNDLKQEIAEREAVEQKLRKSEARFRMAGKVSYDLIYEWDVTTDALQWYGDIDTLLGFEPGEISHDITAWLDLIHPDDHPRLMEAVEHHRTSAEAIQVEYRIRRQDGQYRIWSDSGMPLLSLSEKPHRWIGVCTDVTERRAMEEKLRQSLDEAEKANLAKSRFLAAMSHEIRTPLNGIIGILQQLEEESFPKRSRHKLELMRISSVHLRSVISDILDFSKIESGKMVMVEEDFSLKNLVWEVVATSRGVARPKGIHVVAHWDPALCEWYRGDGAKLRQALTNLVSNGVKFTQEGEVALSVEGMRTEGRVEVDFRVQDTGIGIPESKLETLFSAFTQVDNSLSRSFDGTGLGLAISQHLVTMLGGRISVNSQVGQGSEFRFQIPLTPTGINDPACEMETQEAVRPCSILLVEDDFISQNVFQGFLEEAGHKVTVVATGLEAIDRASEEHFDLILMDLRMPGLNGLEATQRIRRLEDPGLAQVPILAITADVVNETLQQCLEHGMQGVLTKPVDLQELNRWIHKLV